MSILHHFVCVCVLVCCVILRHNPGSANSIHVNSLSREVSLQLVDHFGDRVYRTVVPRNVRLAEAPSFGKPILLYDIRSKGARSYVALAREIIEKLTPHPRATFSEAHRVGVPS